jgi:hypothetical protein
MIRPLECGSVISFTPDIMAVPPRPCLLELSNDISSTPQVMVNSPWFHLLELLLGYYTIKTLSSGITVRLRLSHPAYHCSAVSASKQYWLISRFRLERIINRQSHVGEELYQLCIFCANTVPLDVLIHRSILNTASLRLRSSMFMVEKKNWQQR